MRPDKHFIYGLIFSLIIFLIFPSIGVTGLLIIIFSTIFIDIDHFIYYAFRKKNLSLKKAVVWYTNNWLKFNKFTPEQKEKVYGGAFIFHGIEMLVILLILGVFLSRIFLFIFIGFLFHMFLDWYMEIKLKPRTDKVSFIGDILNFRKLTHIDEI